MSTPSSERAELIRALAVLCERPAPETEAVAAALGVTASPVEHTEAFIHQLPPYASIYLGDEGQIGGDARDRIAGFWRAVGIVPPAEPDHLASMLGLWATLIERAVGEDDPARRLLVEHSSQSLVSQHLAPWLLLYLRRMEEVVPVFRGWAGLLVDLVGEGVGNATVELPITTAPNPEGDPVNYWLTPARCGVILTRSDLKRAASDLSLGLRIGERAFTLRALLDQDRTSVLEWLAREGARQRSLLPGY